MRTEWLRFGGAVMLAAFFLLTAGAPLAAVGLGILLATALMLKRHGLRS